MTQRTPSIRRFLLKMLGWWLPCVWLVAMVLSLLTVIKEVNEVADTRMSQVGRLFLASASRVSEKATLPDVPATWQGLEDIDESDLGFAIWSPTGEQLIADPLGKTLAVSSVMGFVSTGAWWDDDSNRVFYLSDKQGNTVAVVEKREERNEILWGVLLPPLLTLLVALVFMIVLLLWTVKRAFYPLQIFSNHLQTRAANDFSQVELILPEELTPLKTSLNQLFSRIEILRGKEQQFTANVSHELRSPLAAIQAQLDVFSLVTDREQQLHHAQQVKYAVKRANHLVEQMLSMSRLDNLVKLEESEPINWNYLVEDTFNRLNTLAERKSISLSSQFNIAVEQVFPLNGNPVLLAQMLYNLLDNAIRYSEGKNVTLVFQGDKLQVVDDGKGIAPDILGHVRKRFYRPAGQQETGSGLGLSIVERIAEVHGLRVVFESGNTGLCVQIEKDSAMGIG